MALHGFHIPLAALVGILLASSPRLTPRQKRKELPDQTHEDHIDSNESQMELDILCAEEHEIPPNVKRWIPFIALIVAFTQVLGGLGVVLLLRDHNELHARTESIDEFWENFQQYDTLILIEGTPWSHPIHYTDGIGFTRFPSLGLVEVESSPHEESLTCVSKEDIDCLQRLGITHAVSEPMSRFGVLLATSEYWELVRADEGMRLWRLRETPATGSTSHFSSPNAADCKNECQMRKDPWWDSQWIHPPEVNDEYPFIDNGILTWEDNLPLNLRGVPFNAHLSFDAPRGLELRFRITDATDEYQEESITTNGGYSEIHITHEGISGDWVRFDVEVEGGGSIWFNPLGLSGRGDSFFDADGLTTHWVEVRPAI